MPQKNGLSDLTAYVSGLSLSDYFLFIFRSWPRDTEILNFLLK